MSFLEWKKNPVPMWYIRTTSLLLASFVILVGCASSPEIKDDPIPLMPPPPVVVEVEVVEEVEDVETDFLGDDFPNEELMVASDQESSETDCLVDPRFLEQRLRVYETALPKWHSMAAEYESLGLARDKGWNQCQRDVEILVLEYQALQAGEKVDFSSLVRRDIAFLEKGCPALFARYAALVPDVLQGLQEQVADQAQAIIQFYGESGTSTEVIAAIENFEHIREAKITESNLLKIYGNALLENGRFEDAVGVLGQAVEADASNYALRLQVAQLLIATGEYGQARQQYLHLADLFHSWEDYSKTVTDHLALLFATGKHGQELEMYRQVLEGYLSSQGEELPNGLADIVTALQKKYEKSIHATEAARVFGLLEDRVRQQTALRLVEIEKLADGKQYIEALDALEILRGLNLPNDSMQQVAQTQETLVLARTEYIALLKAQHEQDLVDTWQEGLNLRDMQLYDDALSIFEGLLGTRYDAKAAEEIDSIANIAAFSLRKKAAGLFVKAKRTGNSTARLALLHESRDLLEQILSKYPQVKIADKVRVNLQSINKQIDDVLQSSGQSVRPAPPIM